LFLVQDAFELDVSFDESDCVKSISGGFLPNVRRESPHVIGRDIAYRHACRTR